MSHKSPYEKKFEYLHSFFFICNNNPTTMLVVKGQLSLEKYYIEYDNKNDIEKNKIIKVEGKQKRKRKRQERKRKKKQKKQSILLLMGVIVTVTISYSY